MLTPKDNHWHPVMMPEDFLQKQRWAHAQMEAWVESRTRYVLNPEAFVGVPCGSALENDEAADVTPFPDYDADPPPPEVYCQLPDDDDHPPI